MIYFISKVKQINQKDKYSLHLVKQIIQKKSRIKLMTRTKLLSKILANFIFVVHLLNLAFKL